MKKKQTDPLFELSQLFFEMRQTIRANLPDGGGDPWAWMRCEALRFIAEAREPSMRELADRLKITAPSATSLVRKLRRLGWVRYAPSSTDKRLVRIGLTSAGERELARYHKRAETLMRKVFAELPKRDLAHLARALKALRDIHNV